MIKKLLILSVLALMSCTAPTVNNIIIPPPPPDDGGGSGSGGSQDSGGSGGSGTDDGVHCTDIGQTPIVLAYFTEYTTSLPEVRLLTHINYAHGRFANPTEGSGGIVITESDKAPIKDVVALKSVNPRLKVCLMIGGWGGHADGFSMMARSESKRTEFCKSVKYLLELHGLDGVDIDWEYPTQSADNETGADPSDTQNFNLVLKELRETIGTGKIISFASSSSAKYVDWPNAMKYLDYVNVMTYDMGAAPNGHNSPLHQSSMFSHRSWDESIKAHEDRGVPKERMVMGVPFYGKSQKPPSNKESAEYQTYLANKIFDYSVRYYEMPDILENGTYKGKKLARKVFRRWEPTSMVPYLVDEAGVNVLSYDDPESVELKGKYVKNNGHLGAMFWEYRCDTDDHALLKALVKGIYEKESVLE